MALVALICVGGLLWLYLDKVFLIQRLHREVLSVEREERALLDRIQELKRILQQKDELQQLAIRTRLHYGLPGELVVVFEEGP